MMANAEYLSQVTPEVRDRCGIWLEGLDGDSFPDWTVLQGRFLEAMDAYVEAETALPADYEIRSHEAGGQCRVLFPHYRVRGNPAILSHMSAILDVRLTWAREHLFHGYVDCDEVHHEPETFLYFQAPYMHLTNDPRAVAAVEDVAHHVGNWVAGVPDWYDWEQHGFRSTWLGAREVRDFPPYDYQEANHFRFVSIVLAAYVSTGNARYLNLAEDYASRWCEHISAHVHRGEPIVCSIIPQHGRRVELGHAGEVGDRVGKGEYPVYYMAVASNTAYDIAVALLDLYRLTGRDVYRESAGAIIAQFFDHRDSLGRPPYGFAAGQWVHSDGSTDKGTPLSTAGGGANPLLVRMATKYRATTGDTRFDEAILQWADAVDEWHRMEDQVQISLLMAAHELTGDAETLARAYAMALRGIAANEADTRWHHCSAYGRYGFKLFVEDVYNGILSGVDYATRGGLPQLGLAYATENRPGLPDGVLTRTWNPSPDRLMMETVNTGNRAVAWGVSGEAKYQPMDMTVTDGKARLAQLDGGWSINLPRGARACFCAAITARCGS